MIIFLPVARYRVEFQVASGRPFSSFERLVLAAIKEGKNTLDELVLVFAVHRRLVVEAVVTLMQAGWVSLGAKSHEFELTTAGDTACGDQKQLPPTLLLDARVNTIVVEKVAGQIARNSEVDFYPKTKLRGLWSLGVPLPKGNVSNRVDPGMVAPFLQHDSTEWVRSIENPYVVSDNSAYVVVEADTASGRIMGLPKTWEAILVPEILERARRRERELQENNVTVNDSELKALVKIPRTARFNETSEDVAPWAVTSLEKGDVLSSPRSHIEILEHFLTKAVSYVGISGSFLSDTSIQKLIPLLEGAVRRDILITVLWGHYNSDRTHHKVALERLKKLAYDTGQSTNLGRLIVSNTPTGSAANILIADLDSGIEAVLGSYSWTASHAEDEQHISFRLRHPRLVSRLCDILRDLSSTDEKLRISSGIIRLEKGAEQLRAASQTIGEDTGATSVRLILDREHKTSFHDAISGAKHSINIYATEINQHADASLLAQLISALIRGRQTTVHYGRIADNSLAPEPQELFKHGASGSQTATLKHNSLIIDNKLLISSSYRWLSDPLPSQRPYANDIGLAIKANNVNSLTSL